MGSCCFTFRPSLFRPPTRRGDGCVRSSHRPSVHGRLLPNRSCTSTLISTLRVCWNRIPNLCALSKARSKRPSCIEFVRRAFRLQSAVCAVVPRSVAPAGGTDSRPMSCYRGMVQLPLPEHLPARWRCPGAASFRPRTASTPTPRRSVLPVFLRPLLRLLRPSALAPTPFRRTRFPSTSSKTAYGGDFQGKGAAVPHGVAARASAESRASFHRSPSRQRYGPPVANFRVGRARLCRFFPRPACPLLSSTLPRRNDPVPGSRRNLDCRLRPYAR